MRSRSRWVVIGGAAAAALAPLGVIAGSLTDAPAIPGGGVVIGAQDHAGAGGETGSGGDDGGASNGGTADAQRLPTHEAGDAADDAQGDDTAESSERLTAQQRSQDRTDSPRTSTESSHRTAAPAPAKSGTPTVHADADADVDDDEDDEDDSHVVSPASPVSADSPDEDD
jgi:hypothetical protein